MPIAADADVADDARIFYPDLVNLYGCSIGSETTIGPFVEIQKNVSVGARCKVSSHTFICEGVTVEDEVFVGHGVMFINDKHPRATNETGALHGEDDWARRPPGARPAPAPAPARSAADRTPPRPPSPVPARRRARSSHGACTPAAGRSSPAPAGNPPRRPAQMAVPRQRPHPPGQPRPPLHGAEPPRHHHPRRTQHRHRHARRRAASPRPRRLEHQHRDQLDTQHRPRLDRVPGRQNTTPGRDGR